MFEIDPPFGTYALPPAREAWRRKADSYKDNKIGRALISRARKKALAGEAGPFDIEIANDVKARLYPKENRCEKRAFAGVHIWDGAERSEIKKAIQAKTQRPFVFLDVGANVGLYSIYAHAYAKAAGREIRIIAFEPGMETCARLEANLAASNAKVEIIRAAISDAPGTGYLSGNARNRGEAKLDDRHSESEEVVVDTLPRVARTLGLTYIDAMKIDIEGHDEKALMTFFEDAPKKLYPALLIVETGIVPSSGLIELCKNNGYVPAQRTALNTIFMRDDIKKADNG